VVGTVWGIVSHDITNGCPSREQTVSSSGDVDLEPGRHAGGFFAGGTAHDDEAERRILLNAKRFSRRSGHGYIER
jgi:hypothetical protein